jgi:hypothetical protein
VWSQLPRVPASKTAVVDLGGTIVLDVYATLIIAHSEKEQAAATFKHGFGFHPIGVWCSPRKMCQRKGKGGRGEAGSRLFAEIGNSVSAVDELRRSTFVVDFASGPGRGRREC